MGGGGGSTVGGQKQQQQAAETEAADPQQEQQKQQQRDPKAGGPNTKKSEGHRGGGAPKRWGPEGWWGPTFALFSFSHLLFHSLCSLKASYRGISVCFRCFLGIRANFVTIGY